MFHKGSSLISASPLTDPALSQEPSGGEEAAESQHGGSSASASQTRSRQASPKASPKPQPARQRQPGARKAAGKVAVPTIVLRSKNNLNILSLYNLILIL